MKNEITVPLEIFEKDFDLIEIGLIILLLASPHIKENRLTEWSQNEDFLKVFESLMNRGYIYMSKNDQGKTVTNIDLEPKKEPNMNITTAQRKLAKELGLPEEKIKQIAEILDEVSSSAYLQGYNDRKIEEETGFMGYGKKEDFE